MIYNIHHFYYWSRGGVETGEAYRAKIFRELGLEAKFIFATPFPNQVFQHEMSRLGFLDSEVEWMYGSFTDCKVSPVTYTLDMFLKSLEGQPYTLVRQGVSVKIYIDGTSTRYVAELTNETDNYVRRILLLSRECILRIDHYTYCRIYSEFYAPKDGQAQFYLRRFYNENGSTAYEELVNGENILYRFPDRILYSREELVGYMMSRLHLTADDVVLIDGEPGNIEMSAFIDNAYPARVGLFLHADHCMAQAGDHVRWYYIYEYAFAHPEKISFFMTNTDAQTRELKEQFKKYRGVSPTVLTIPASGIQELIVPKAARKKHSLITAGRLAPEKNTAWVIKAVTEARKQISDLTLDIYGEGAEYGKLKGMIESLNCGDYIRLCGYQKISDLYQTYDAYVSASFCETLGITYLEAVGSGLPVVAFDIPYGAQSFIDDGMNGYKVKYGDVQGLAEGIVKLFQQDDLESFREHSYQKAREYLREEIAAKWNKALSSGTSYS